MRFLRVFLVVGAALLPAACMPATRACTEIGCSDLLRIAFDRTVPANYSVSFTVGNNEGHADC